MPDITPDSPVSARLEIGPPLPGPPMCFPCVTGTCGHSGRDSTHGGGYVPAVTYLHGTALCQDCAHRAADDEQDAGQQ